MIIEPFGTAATNARERKPYWGYNDEYWFAMNYDIVMRDFVARHKMFFRLREEDGNPARDVPFTHEATHSLLGTALTLAPRTPSMLNKIAGHFYQANMQGELLVLPIQKMVLEPLLQDPEGFEIPDTGELMALCDLHYERDGGRLEGLGIMGAKACYYIGKKTGQTMFDVGLQYNFHNGLQIKAAEALAEEYGESYEQAAARHIDDPHDWQEKYHWVSKIKENDPYFINGEPQQVTRVVRPSADPDTRILLEIIRPALCWLKSVIRHPDMLEDVSIRELRDVMQEARLTPVLDHFKGAKPLILA